MEIVSLAHFFESLGLWVISPWRHFSQKQMGQGQWENDWKERPQTILMMYYSQSAAFTHEDCDTDRCYQSLSSWRWTWSVLSASRRFAFSARIVCLWHISMASNALWAASPRDRAQSLQQGRSLSSGDEAIHSSSSDICSSNWKYSWSFLLRIKITQTEWTLSTTFAYENKLEDS